MANNKFHERGNPKDQLLRVAQVGGVWWRFKNSAPALAGRDARGGKMSFGKGVERKIGDDPRMEEGF